MQSAKEWTVRSKAASRTGTDKQPAFMVIESTGPR